MPDDAPDAPLPTALEAAMRRAAETGRVQLVDTRTPGGPATPPHLIPDELTRRRETVGETWDRVMPYLSAEVRSRLAQLPPLKRRQIAARIVEAERLKERVATATETPSPKQRREARRREQP